MRQMFWPHCELAFAPSAGCDASERAARLAGLLSSSCCLIWPGHVAPVRRGGLPLAPAPGRSVRQWPFSRDSLIFHFASRLVIHLELGNGRLQCIHLLPVLSIWHGQFRTHLSLHDAFLGLTLLLSFHASNDRRSPSHHSSNLLLCPAADQLPFQGQPSSSSVFGLSTVLCNLFVQLIHLLATNLFTREAISASWLSRCFFLASHQSVDLPEEALCDEI